MTALSYSESLMGPKCKAAIIVGSVLSILVGGTPLC